MSSEKSNKFKRDFYSRPTLDVINDIIGKIIVYDSSKGRLSARIVEAEAYIGEDDPACHAAVGKTERNEVMFGMPGFTYIYFIYGMYHCLNFVTEPEAKPAAILIRGAEPLDGIEIMKQNSLSNNERNLLNGPGKFCRSFGLDRKHNGLDLTGEIIYLESDSYKPKKIITTPRIGIKQGKNRLWRFYDTASDCVSRK